MQPAASSPAAPRVALRCDGDDEIGAGHVARCIPIAAAFSRRGWDAILVGRYGGLARWLLDRAALPVQPPQDGPAGLRARDWSAAVVDGYGFHEPQLCALARALPVAFVAEAGRCPGEGVHVDYHAGAVGAPAPNVLAGPHYAPVDPRFAATHHERQQVRVALVTVGGSGVGKALAAPAVQAVRAAFPDARVVVASGAEVPEQDDVVALAYPSSLLDVVGDVDVAVSAAGLTAYELACAGVPSVLVAVAPNQASVIDAFRRAEAALTVADGDPAELAAAVARLRDPQVRHALRETGRRLVDGLGASRIAAALEERWLSPSAARR